MAELPTGTVTFLFTDIERSTRLLDQDAATMRGALVRHHELVRSSIEANTGTVFETVGDAVYAAFARSSDALAAAIGAQRALHETDWGVVGEIRARMAIHTGEVVQRDDYHYVGVPLVRCARLLVLGHGGQTLVSQATAALVRDALPSGASLIDLGEHKLKDLRALEHVFQLDGRGLPSSFPPLRSTDARPHNLPAQATRFVGRAREVAQLGALAAEARLVTLVGLGGVGKTRLALEVAARMLDDLADGAWLIDLSAVDQPAAVEQEVAASLGVRDEDGVGTQRSILDHLRERHLLLVLDNCEHLIDSCARLAALLIRAAPNVRIVATSRTPLGTAGERVWHVEGLDEAVALFVDRATTTVRDFEPADTDLALIERICERLDRTPLAIELAARRVRVLALSEIDQRLEDRFRLLSGPRGPDQRHETLRATIDWSYRLLDETERRLWTRLAIFSGGFTLEHAEAVCADDAVARDEILDLVAGLVDKSLLLVDRTADGGIRYRQPETLRAYARERLTEAGEADVLARRHADWALAFADRGRERVLGGADQALWVECMAREKDNIRAAIAWALDHDEVPIAARLGTSFGRVWTIRWLTTEWQWWIASIEPRLGVLAGELRWDALMLVANMHGWLGEYDRAASAFWEALEIAEALGARSAKRETLVALGSITADRGEDDAAERHYLDALALVGDDGVRSRAAAEFGLAHIALRRGDPASARERFVRAAELRRGLKDNIMVARALMGLAQALVDLDDPMAAERAANESLALFTALGAPNGIRGALGMLAEIYDRRGEGDLALPTAERALEQARAGAGRVATADTLNTLAEIELGHGKNERAEERAREVLRTVQPIEPERIEIIVRAHWVLARGAAASGDWVRAATLAAAARAHRDRTRAVAPRGLVEQQDALLARAVAVLGQEAFDRSARVGQAFDVDGATAYTLASSSSVTPA